MCLQFAVEYALQTVVFDGAGHVSITSENLGAKAMRLRRLFYLLGIVVLCLSPFIFLLRVSLYIFRYVDDWRRRPGTLGARCWDPGRPVAAPAVLRAGSRFDSRLRRAHRPTTQYVRMFTNEISSIAARVVLVVCGGFVLVSFALALFVDEAYLLADLVPGYSVAFFIGWSGLVMALASALVPDENRVFEPKARLERAAEFMQYYPDEWRGNEAMPVTYEAVARLFPFKLSVFAKEALAVVGTPLMLLMRLAPDRGPLSISMRGPNAGAIWSAMCAGTPISKMARTFGAPVRWSSAWCNSSANFRGGTRARLTSKMFFRGKLRCLPH